MNLTVYHDFWITQIEDKELLCQFYFAIGKAFYDISELDYLKKSLSPLLEAKELISKKENQELNFDITHILGNCYYKIGVIPMAEKYYNLARVISSEGLAHDVDKFII